MAIIKCTDSKLPVKRVDFLNFLNTQENVVHINNILNMRIKFDNKHLKKGSSASPTRIKAKGFKQGILSVNRVLLLVWSPTIEKEGKINEVGINMLVQGRIDLNIKSIIGGAGDQVKSVKCLLYAGRPDSNLQNPVF